MYKNYQMPSWWYLIRGCYLLLFLYRSGFLRQLKFFRSNIGQTHLEIPCGDGFVFNFYKPKTSPVIWLCDVSVTMVSRAVSRFINHPNIHCFVMDVEQLGVPKDSFDTVNIPNGFHCFPNPSMAILELHRVMKVGGILKANVLLEPKTWFAKKNVEYFKRKGDLAHTFQPRELTKLFEKGFKIISSDIHGNTMYLVVQKLPPKTGNEIPPEELGPGRKEE